MNCYHLIECSPLFLPFDLIQLIVMTIYEENLNKAKNQRGSLIKDLNNEVGAKLANYAFFLFLKILKKSLMNASKLIIIRIMNRTLI
ncbi:hypothetical protein BpHYR1_000351 [Brachionus plicatilis]|uniref:Uncharacterized protein n=1 Tax=Brachionus plicatilis TaxID=10195 RepID=A0A3M7SCI7_BRAPC|nr:hypothetical protein BpHYR1_000351 [Brachionus plicatilis]